MKKIWLSMLLSFVVLLSGCGTNYEKQLVGTWYREGASSPAFILYDDGTCEIDGEYGTGSWAVVNDDQFKLTNFYGESETATIAKADKETFVITDGSNEVRFYKTPTE